MVSLPRGGQEARKNRAVGSGWYGSSAPASEWGVSFTRLAQLSSNMVKQTLTEPAKWLLFKEKIPVVCSRPAVRPWLPSAFVGAAALPYLHPALRKSLLSSISAGQAAAPGWSSREPAFKPEWVDKVPATVF